MGTAVAEAGKNSKIGVVGVEKHVEFTGERAKKSWPAFSALWSLLWRSVVLAPFALVAGGIWLLTWPLLILLPVFEIICVINHDWFWVSVIPLVWFSLFLLARLRWFKADHRDFPNDQENI